MKRLATGALTLLVAFVAGCGGDGDVETETSSSIAVTSSAFDEGAPIPEVYSCRGLNVSPPLAWSGVPADAAALALVVDDPDAPGGSYVHWVVVDIDADTTSVSERALPSGGVQAENSGGDARYVGPCPPSGTHRYRFTVYALSEPTGLSDGAPLNEALEAISANAISQGTLTGTFAAESE